MQLPPLLPATLVRRYKRFLADVRLADGSLCTVHCPNSGSMLGCDRPGSQVLLSTSENRRRKYAHTLEMVQVDGVWVGINTVRTNAIVEEGLRRGVVRELAGFVDLQREVRVSGRSRLDFRLIWEDRRCYLEVKNCTLAADGIARFPDAVTERGTRHLEELAGLAAEGHGAAVLFCVQRADAERFQPAADIDSRYAATLRAVQAAGVLVLAYQARVTPAAIELVRSLPVELGGPV